MQAARTSNDIMELCDGAGSTPGQESAKLKIR